MSVQAVAEHPVSRCVAEMAASLAAVRDVDAIYLPAAAHRDALVELTRLAGQLEELRMRVIDAAGGPGGLAQDDGARSPASWLASRTLTGYGAARRAELLASAISQRWGRVGEALADGRMRVEQAHVIVKALDDLPSDEVAADVLDRAEAHLVALAETYEPRKLELLASRILEVVAPEHYDELERQALERAQRRANNATRLTIHPRGDGASDVKARVPDAVASRLRTLLEAWTSPRHAASSGDVSGRDPATGARLTQERLMGLAFCSLLESVDPARLPAHGGASTQIVITIDLEALRSGLGHGTLATSGDRETPVSVGEVRRLACHAGIVPAVLGSRSEVLDLGRSSRLFSPAQRRAALLRRRTCAGQGCTIPAAWCEAHHRRDPWSQGGTTDLDDLELLCLWHHQRAHDPTYTTERLANGDVRFARRT
ncbi:DUF222 domain-containing protein [Nocardioides sp. zg-DK7169]|uniref:DUF222 domain-containing protein n=1 Tax=Nocardioides sp. zg-DK7169 TaxID=2736600 RepID=UPI003463BFCC